MALIDEEERVILVRFRDGSASAWGIVENGAVFRVIGSIYENPRSGDRVGVLSDLTLLAPAEPTKIVGYAGNYQRLMTRGGTRPLPDLSDFEPMLFLKSPTCLAGPDEPVIYPRVCTRVWHEPELCFVVKRPARYVSVADAPSYVLGYTIGNDVTADNVHGRDNHLARSKSFDTWSPAGPVLVTDLDPRDLSIKLWVNGQLAVDERTSDMIWDVPRVLSEISKVMTLLPGDLVYTGVPMFITQELRIVKPGDVMEMEIEGIGRMKNPVVAEE
ncbi:MAG TPA: fumarylacetoacetate hydrolase family protein [Chloroflexota bacterium]|nr:fumarylacetoacetate hydrolase family protein [Chloroflexota bacterium]